MQPTAEQQHSSNTVLVKAALQALTLQLTALWQAVHSGQVDDL